MHEVLVNRLGGLSLPRKSVVRLTDRPDMTLDVYRGRKTTNQQLMRGHNICFHREIRRVRVCLVVCENLTEPLARKDIFCWLPYLRMNDFSFGMHNNAD